MASKPANEQERVAATLQISDDRLLELLERIRPIVRFEVERYDEYPLTPVKPRSLGIPFWVEMPRMPSAPRQKDPLYVARHVAMGWDPEPKNEAQGIRLLGAVITYHVYGAPSMFKPTIAGVIAQLDFGRQIGSIEYFNDIIGFEICDDNLTHKNVVGRYHWAPTMLYGAVSG